MSSTNEILRKASAFFCDGGARPPREMMMSFTDVHYGVLGIVPICRELKIARSFWHEHAVRLADADRCPAGARRDDETKVHIEWVHRENFGLYGSCKVWHQMDREGIKVTKCSVERQMRTMGWPVYGAASPALPHQQPEGTVPVGQGQPGV